MFLQLENTGLIDKLNVVWFKILLYAQFGGWQIIGG